MLFGALASAYALPPPLPRPLPREGGGEPKSLSPFGRGVGVRGRAKRVVPMDVT